MSWVDTAGGQSREQQLHDLAGAGQLASTVEADLNDTALNLLHCRVDCPTCGTQHVDTGCYARFNHRVHVCMACNGRFESATPCVGVLGVTSMPPRVSR